MDVGQSTFSPPFLGTRFLRVVMDVHPFGIIGGMTSRDIIHKCGLTIHESNNSAHMDDHRQIYPLVMTNELLEMARNS